MPCFRVQLDWETLLQLHVIQPAPVLQASELGTLLEVGEVASHRMFGVGRQSLQDKKPRCGLCKQRLHDWVLSSVYVPDRNPVINGGRKGHTCFVWANAIGGHSDDCGEAITANSDEETLVAGSFSGNVDFSSGEGGPEVIK